MISIPTVPFPAIILASSKGWMKTSPSDSHAFMASAKASSKVSPMRMTETAEPPNILTWLTFWPGVVLGM
ncbi:hypothetical protein D3C73_1627500 [compost metagenome]